MFPFARFLRGVLAVASVAPLASGAGPQWDLMRDFSYSCPGFGYTQPDDWQHCCGEGSAKRELLVPSQAVPKPFGGVVVDIDPDMPQILRIPTGVLNFQVNLTAFTGANMDLYLFDPQAHEYVVHWRDGFIHQTTIRDNIMIPPRDEGDYKGLFIKYRKHEESDFDKDSITIVGMTTEPFDLQVGNRELKDVKAHSSYSYDAAWDPSCGAYSKVAEVTLLDKERLARERAAEAKKRAAETSRLRAAKVAAEKAEEVEKRIEAEEKAAKEKAAQEKAAESEKEKEKAAALQRLKEQMEKEKERLAKEKAEKEAAEKRAAEKAAKERAAKQRAKEKEEQKKPTCVLTRDAPAHATELHCDSIVGFKVGDYIKIGEEQYNQINGFASLIIRYPLEYFAPAGTTVTIGSKEEMMEQRLAEEKAAREAEERQEAQRQQQERMKTLITTLILVTIVICCCICLWITYLKKHEDSVRALKANEEAQALLREKRKREAEESVRRKREQAWLMCRKKAEEDPAWLYWLGGDGQEKGTARITQGFISFHRYDITDRNRQDLIMKLNVGDEFIFWADNREYVGKVTVAPVCSVKEEIYFRTDAPYPPDAQIGVFSISAFEYVTYKGTRLIYYTESFMRSWPIQRLREYATFLQMGVGYATIGSMVPGSDKDVLPWIVDVQRRFLSSDIKLSDAQQARLKNERNRALEDTRVKLTAKEDLHYDALPFRPNSEEFDNVELWEEQMRNVAEAWAGSDVALLIQVTTDGSNPNAMIQGKISLEMLLEARAQRVKTKLALYGVPEEYVKVGVPKYQYRDKSGVHSKLIISPMTLEEARRKEEDMEKRRRRLQEMNSRSANDGSMFVDCEFLPNKVQIGQGQKVKLLEELKQVKSQMEGNQDRLNVTITTTTVDPGLDDDDNPSMLRQLIRSRAKLIENILLEAGIDPRRVTMRHPKFGAERNMLMMSFDRQTVSLELHH